MLWIDESNQRYTVVQCVSWSQRRTIFVTLQKGGTWILLGITRVDTIELDPLAVLANVLHSLAIKSKDSRVIGSFCLEGRCAQLGSAAQYRRLRQLEGGRRADHNRRLRPIVDETETGSYAGGNLIACSYADRPFAIADHHRPVRVKQVGELRTRSKSAFVGREDRVGDFDFMSDGQKRTKSPSPAPKPRCRLVSDRYCRTS